MAKSNAARSDVRGQQGGGALPQAQKPSGNDKTALAASDQLYGVVSVLYHALQGEQTYGKYLEDARSANDDELSGFFDDCRKEEAKRARRAKSLLLDRLEDESGEDEDEDDDADSDDDEETSDASV